MSPHAARKRKARIARRAEPRPGKPLPPGLLDAPPEGADPKDVDIIITAGDAWIRWTSEAGDFIPEDRQ